VTAPVQALPTTAGTWVASDSRTTVGFACRNLGRLVRGSLACSWGEVELDAAGAPVRARAELDLTSLDTGIARRDTDLRKPRLLDIDRHPVMTWTCDRFRPDADGGWIAEGELRLRGTGAPLVVHCVPEAAAADGSCVRVRAIGEIDRRTVGVRAPSWLIGHTVTVSVDAWLERR
jgi:polyisoprenoid-binding protein YceI